MAGVYIVTCRMRNEYNEYWGDKRRENRDLVALPGLEPGLFALRGRRVNQLHHNATARKRFPLRLFYYTSSTGRRAKDKAKTNSGVFRLRRFAAPLKMTTMK